MKINNLLCVALCLFISACSKSGLAPDIQQSLNKANSYVTNFSLAHSRLPTRDEYWAWHDTNDLIGVGDYEITGNDTNNYNLYIWLGERTVVYSSKTKTITDK